MENTKTKRCPFCYETHNHGRGEGHRIPHCSNEKKEKSVIADDGTILYQNNGYIIRK